MCRCAKQYRWNATSTQLLHTTTTTTYMLPNPPVDDVSGAADISSMLKHKLIFATLPFADDFPLRALVQA